MQRPGPGKNLPCKGTKFLTAKMLGENAVEVVIRSHETEFVILCNLYFMSRKQAAVKDLR